MLRLRVTFAVCQMLQPLCVTAGHWHRGGVADRSRLTLIPVPQIYIAHFVDSQ